MNKKIRKELDFILRCVFAENDPHKATHAARQPFAKPGNDKRWEILVAILENDGYIRWSYPPTQGYYMMLTPAAKTFIQFSGYEKQGTKEWWQQAWTITKSIAAIVNAIILLYLSYLSAVQ